MQQGTERRGGPPLKLVSGRSKHGTATAAAAATAPAPPHPAPGIPSDESLRLPTDLDRAHGSESLSDFIVPTHDDQGHSENLITRCPRWFKSQIQAIVQSRNSPFPDTSAFIRWACLRGMRYLADSKLDKGVTNTQAVINLMVMRHQQQWVLLHYRKTVEDMAEIVRELEAAGHKGRAKELVTSALRDVGQIDDKEWRKHWMTEIRTRYKYLLK